MIGRAPPVKVTLHPHPHLTSLVANPGSWGSYGCWLPSHIFGEWQPAHIFGALPPFCPRFPVSVLSSPLNQCQAGSLCLLLACVDGASQMCDAVRNWPCCLEPQCQQNLQQQLCRHPVLHLVLGRAFDGLPSWSTYHFQVIPPSCFQVDLP